MSFQVRQHIIPGQHVRQTPSSRGQVIRLAIKQYIPLNNPDPSPGDITIIAAHANGIVKEAYEPLWEDLSRHLEAKGIKIRSIWFADQWNQGESGVLNEEGRLDESSWYDHTRDLLCLINHFRAEIQEPIIAVGHSMGANQLAMLSLSHPTLFKSLILIDPIIQKKSIEASGPVFTKGVLRRKVSWSSRAEAERTFSKAFRGFDARVLDKIGDFGLSPNSGENTGEEGEKAVKLATGRFQELAAIIRPTFIQDGSFDFDKISWAAESRILHDILEYISCSVAFVCGKESISAGEEIRNDWEKRTGTGENFGRRGRERRVSNLLVEKCGHFVPFEKPDACARVVAGWIESESEFWKEEAKVNKRWSDLSLDKKAKEAAVWMEGLKSKI